MSLIKWEPFGQFDKFFEDFSSVSFPKVGADLAVDVFEKDGKILAEMNIPGIDPDKIEVSVEDNYLRVAGSHSEEKEEKEKHYYSKEIRRGSFERIVPLPAAVDQEKIEAEYNNGVLHISMPKVEKVKEKKVEVKVKK